MIRGRSARAGHRTRSHGATIARTREATGSRPRQARHAEARQGHPDGHEPALCVALGDGQRRMRIMALLGPLHDGLPALPSFEQYDDQDPSPSPEYYRQVTEPSLAEQVTAWPPVLAGTAAGARPAS